MVGEIIPEWRATSVGISSIANVDGWACLHKPIDSRQECLVQQRSVAEDFMASNWEDFMSTMG